MKPSRILSALFASMILLSACGSDSSEGGVAEPGTDSAPMATEVVMERSRFLPRELDVQPGTTVTFRNSDPFAHTVTSTAESTLAFDSGDLGGDESFEVTFDEAGVYSYFCEIHPTMRATVVVG